MNGLAAQLTQWRMSFERVHGRAPTQDEIDQKTRPLQRKPESSLSDRQP